MSPNLLWSAETNDADYVSKVNSTAWVNTIVEALVSDWSYYFGDDFAISDFYITMSRDELFPHNGGFPVDRDFSTDNIMTKSLNIVASGANNQINHPNQSVGSSNINSYQTHSRSSSHDTSLILIENEITSGSTDSLTKRSQSNSSLSDSSPPPQSSPKLPIRRKNTKKAAPTPPDNRVQRAAEHYSSINSGSHQSTTSETMQAMKERFLNSCPPQDDSKFNSNRFIRNEAKAQMNATFKPPLTPISMKQCSSSTENLSATKPDKPPRPAMPVIDSQTLVRNAFKSKGSERHSRPVALPRNILNVARSTENLSTLSPVQTSPGANSTDDNDIVQLRDRSNENNRNDKPAIPERPTSLMKSNVRAAFDKFESHHMPDSPGIKKTQSFRMSSTPVGNSMGSITGRSLTTLERTHIYNVDKKQVEIIDVDQQSNGSDNSTNEKNSSSSDKENSDKEKDCIKPDKSTRSNRSSDSNGDEIKPCESTKESTDTNHLSTSTGNTMSSSTINSSNECTVPQSTRCFEPKVIKRPQIPAPPPPNATIDQTSNEQSRKTDTAAIATTADFTKL